MNLKIVQSLSALVICLALTACVESSQYVIEERAEAVQQQEVVKPVVTGPEAVYQQQVEQLTTLECAQCHYTVFSTIRDAGGKHIQECRFCHENFHSMKPGKAWSEVVPACTNCHGEFHGSDFLQCLECHTNAHAPILSLVNMDNLSQNCSTCHNAQASEVVQSPSAHSEVLCSECHHTQHGFKPECIECHDTPHVTYESIATCEVCHPVHKPMDITIAADTSNNACAGCHGDVVSKLAVGKKKHAQLACVYCHKDQHPNVPVCQDCHGTPHSPAMLKKFDGCSDCHGDPHELSL